MNNPKLTVVVSSLVLSVLGCGDGAQPAATDDHLHGGDEAITIWTDRVELFFEHPALIAGAPGEPWAVHLTSLSDFQPVYEGSLTLRFVEPGGGELTHVSEASARPGIYTPSPSFPGAGMYDLTVEIAGPQVSDEIFVGPIQVFASESDLPHLPPEEAVGIGFLKEQQWPIGMVTVEATRREVSPVIPVSGEIVAVPNRSAEITAPVEGILQWDSNSQAPTLGSRVRRGQPLVRLSPVGGEDSFASLKLEMELLEREVARAERLVEAEAIPARRLEEARLALDATRARLEALGASDEEGYSLTLSAPMAGVITSRSFTPGQRVSSGQSLFTILDPRRLWIRFHVPASRAHELETISGATFSPEGSAEVFRTDEVNAVSAALDPVRRTVPVTMEVDNSDGRLRPGMLATGRILSGVGEATLAVPVEAVLDENGVMVAYVQIGGETFERRALSLGKTDGQWTEVLSGVRPGERVVTLGAFQIRLSSLNTSEISDHGHVH